MTCAVISPLMFWVQNNFYFTFADYFNFVRNKEKTYRSLLNTQVMSFFLTTAAGSVLTPHTFGIPTTVMLDYPIPPVTGEWLSCTELAVAGQLDDNTGIGCNARFTLVPSEFAVIPPPPDDIGAAARSQQAIERLVARGKVRDPPEDIAAFVASASANVAANVAAHAAGNVAANAEAAANAAAAANRGKPDAAAGTEVAAVAPVHDEVAATAPKNLASVSVTLYRLCTQWKGRAYNACYNLGLDRIELVEDMATTRNGCLFYLVWDYVYGEYYFYAAEDYMFVSSVPAYPAPTKFANINFVTNLTYATPFKMMYDIEGTSGPVMPNRIYYMVNVSANPSTPTDLRRRFVNCTGTSSSAGTWNMVEPGLGAPPITTELVFIPVQIKVTGVSNRFTYNIRCRNTTESTYKFLCLNEGTNAIETRDGPGAWEEFELIAPNHDHNYGGKFLIRSVAFPWCYLQGNPFTNALEIFREYYPEREPPVAPVPPPCVPPPVPSLSFVTDSRQYFEIYTKAPGFPPGGYDGIIP